MYVTHPLHLAMYLLLQPWNEDVVQLQPFETIERLAIPRSMAIGEGGGRPGLALIFLSILTPGRRDHPVSNPR